MTTKAKATMIVDLQYGSTGKGLIAGYLAMRDKPDVVVTANMPNAGHTFIDSKGQKMVHKALPNGVVSPNCKWALIGPGAVFSVMQLRAEILQLADMGYGHFKVGIHANAVPMRQRYVDAEQTNVKIGSTMQGSGAALVAKIRRDPEDAVIAEQVRVEISNILGIDLIDRVHILSAYDYRFVLEEANHILLEGAQGFSLGVSERFYPFCTSRDCTPARFLADMSVPIPMLDKVVGTCRVHPIRVGNPPGGYSGDCYSDQQEISWESLGVQAELTTVTKRIRRVFTFSHHQYEDAMMAVCPDEVFLNFCNYATGDLYHHLYDTVKPKYTGWGATINDVREEY